jgi:hypothetical protein
MLYDYFLDDIIKRLRNGTFNKKTSYDELDELYEDNKKYLEIYFDNYVYID